MFSSKIMVIYRIITLLMLSIPTVINIYSNGDIVSSIIYVPLITLGLSAIAIFLDGKLEAVLNRGMILTKFRVPTANSYLKTTSDIKVSHPDFRLLKEVT
ncbi:hypothetical protein [Colwellia sp. Bg11-28]|uniref:hypothetical protein n=1 Tax=Colwellia sp. Bg11-28 TaxID=2058305 RepID=UPI000C331326|nr:hypothetical protein [Colwellia sp. Bg11-28]PKH86266.1 hypothetical protein CXF79_16245 [Colwellia sp. Bg11-28]